MLFLTRDVIFNLAKLVFFGKILLEYGAINMPLEWKWEPAKHIDLRFILFYKVLGRCVGFPGKALPGKSAIIGVISLDDLDVTLE